MEHDMFVGMSVDDLKTKITDLYDIIEILHAKPPAILTYGTVKPLLDQLGALHALVTDAAIYFKERRPYCRYCKMRVDPHYFKRNHDSQCPINRVMRGDIPEHLRHTDEGWLQEEGTS